MTRLQIHVADDGLTAVVEVRAGAAATADELRAALADAEVVYGVDDDAVAALAQRLADPDARGRFEVARGAPAVDGHDGELRGDAFCGPRAGKRGPNDRVDFRERHILHPARTGGVVATVVEPTAGTAGRDVRDRLLRPTHGRPFVQRLGDGVRRDGGSLRATRDGVVLATQELVDVVTLYEHAGNVDYRSGNLHTAGSLLVKGDVDDGFCATASGDVAVQGTVQGGVEAEGSVHVERSVLGDALVVRAGADVTCRVATSTRLFAGRSIVVHDQAAQSELQAPRVFVTEGRGSVRGGTVRAREEIEVLHAGADSGVVTVLAAAQLLDERQELARRSAASAREQRGASRLGTTKRERAAVRAGDRERDELLRLRRLQRQHMREAVVRVLADCHPGVVVRIGPCRLELAHAQRGVEFRYDDDTGSITTTQLP